MSQKHLIKLSTIASYFGEEAKSFAKGENAVESGHVEKMQYDAELKTIRGNIHASMKNRIYNVEIQLTADYLIESSSCCCPRGIKFHHIAALLIFAHYNISVTDTECTWRSTKNASNQVSTCDDLYPRTPYSAINRKITPDELQNLRGQLNTFGGTVGFSWLLQEESVATVAALPVPLIEEILTMGEFLLSEDGENFIRIKCRVTDEVKLQVANLTIGQASNNDWHLIRKYRLTASNFGNILASVSRQRFPESLFKSLAGLYNLDSVRAIQWGKLHEQAAIKSFEDTMKLKVTPTGIWLSTSGILGASPDGLVGNDAIIEVKCPYSLRNDVLQDTLKDPKYILYLDHNNDIIVNKNHIYYDQIQGILHFVNRALCYLVLWTPKSTIIAKIYQDNEWANNLPLLEDFYMRQYLPKLLNYKF